jgi:hypothetical protein
MRSSIRAKGLRALVCAAATALLVGAALPALAEGGSARGKGLLGAKDATAMTLQLDDVLLQVTDETAIFDADKRQIAFATIPDPSESASLITWSGVRSGKDKVRATRLEVVIPPQ